MLNKVQRYFDGEYRKHPSFLLFDTSPTNFLFPSEAYARELLGDFDAGLRILEIGSGDSKDSITLAGSNNKVWAIEISPRRLGLARQNVKNAGKNETVLPIHMDAHKLGFPDNCFDLILGNSVLLFLERKSFALECYRVLKPGGRALFSNESMAKHPILVLRRALPKVNQREKVAYRISLSEIAEMSERFDGAKHRQFYLFSVLLVPFVERFGGLKLVARLTELAHKSDVSILHQMPFLRDYCWISVIEFYKGPAAQSAQVG